MKKSILVLLSAMIVVSTVAAVSAKTTTNTSLSSGIRSYKAGNYTQSYNTFSEIVKRDPSNAVAYYYLAMSAVQVGKKDEAIENYTRVIDLSTSRQLTSYATKGKRCIEDPERCNEPEVQETDVDSLVKTRNSFSEQARGEYEKLKIENLMREINRNGDVPANKFKEYKDFSSEVPTNDEIVSAMRVLQRAGLSNFATNSYNSDLSLLTGRNNNLEMLNILTGNNTQVSPQVIQALLTGQMNAGF